MIKPQNVPDIFEDFRKALRIPAVADAHMHRSFTSKALAYKYVADSNTDMPELSQKHVNYFTEVVQEKFSITREILDEGSLALLYCDDDMSDMIEMAASVLEEDDFSDVSLIEIEDGFCYFTKGISLTKDMKIHVLVWHQIYNALTENTEYLVTAYNDHYNEADGSIETWKESFSSRGFETPHTRWVYRSDSPYVSGELMAPTKATVEAVKSNGGLPISITPSQVFHALTLMLRQPPEVVEISKREATNKKQLKRLKTKKVPSEVTVVDVRHKYRYTSGTRSESEIEYSRRWLVIGHWRWQPYKDAETRDWVKKRIWIAPYIKGPDDKPFVATKRVHALLK